MLNKQYILSLILICFCAFTFAQEGEPTKETDTISEKEIPKTFKKKKKQLDRKAKKEAKRAEKKNIVIDSTTLGKQVEYDPLAPSKAAFYSAILPGLGQAYNKKYWKIPIVVGAITGGILVYDFNNKQYKRARDAYKRRLAGFSDDEFQGVFDDDNLREKQTNFRRSKELSLLVTIGIYALNIIDANVDAHLLQYNINEDLSLKPHYKIEQFDNVGRVGLTLNLSLN